MSETDPLADQERRKYERMWEHPEYRDDHVTGDVRAAVSEMGARAGDSIIDVGAGAGYASAWLQAEGYGVLAIDIAANAMAPDLRGRIPILIGNLWQMPVAIHADWGFCGDVMEHIPPDRVDDVLRFIRASTRRATWFSIALRPDGCGMLIGQALHLTVREGDWWFERLRAHWAAVRVLAHQPGHQIVLLAEGFPAPPAPAAGTETARAMYAERMRELARRMAACGVRDLLVFGAADAGRALAESASEVGLRVHGFVRSQPAPGEMVDGLPVWSPAEAAQGVHHTYAIGSFRSAPAMVAALEAAYAGRDRLYQVFLPEGPAPAEGNG